MKGNKLSTITVFEMWVRDHYFYMVISENYLNLHKEDSLYNYICMYI